MLEAGQAKLLSKRRRISLIVPSMPVSGENTEGELGFRMGYLGGVRGICEGCEGVVRGAGRRGSSGVEKGVQVGGN